MRDLLGFLGVLLGFLGRRGKERRLGEVTTEGKGNGPASYREEIAPTVTKTVR